MLGESRWKGVTVKRTEAEKLLGGHATGILTLEERKILFAAALERQDMERAVQGLSLRLSGRILEKVVQGLFSEDERARIVARGLERIGRVNAPLGGSGSQ